mgnify:CR=1 FL=1
MLYCSLLFSFLLPVLLFPEYLRYSEDMLLMYLWVGASFFIILAVLFYYYSKQLLAKNMNLGYLLTLIPMVMAGVYLAMINGVFVVLVDDYWFYFARFIGWFIVSPIAVYIVCLVTFKKTALSKDKTWIAAILFSMVPIAFGALAIFSYDVGRVLALCMGSIGLILFLYLALLRFPEHIKKKTKELYNCLAALLGVVGTIYFVVAILTEPGLALISVETEIGIYAFLDIFSVGLLGYLIFVRSNLVT